MCVGGDDGFTLGVSAAVETTGLYHTQQHRHCVELIDKLLLCPAQNPSLGDPFPSPFLSRHHGWRTPGAKTRNYIGQGP